VPVNTRADEQSLGYRAPVASLLTGAMVGCVLHTTSCRDRAYPFHPPIPYWGIYSLLAGRCCNESLAIHALIGFGANTKTENELPHHIRRPFWLELCYSSLRVSIFDITADCSSWEFGMVNAWIKATNIGHKILFKALSFRVLRRPCPLM